ncbi:cytidylyltransferase domain-containing protein [Vibrio coralliilyticus]|uniref:acylneuraminate cytidylyltransferase family protein n=1 Tax=Vibrio coralliilyticus TaxID=190893 RepID=UPI0015613AF6|nr:acylneuraminate cytidylyltransferase family protein [Vibrio coralliilyticus]NRF32509.1 acylneuraminate cytidylyltransferase family protein [Vibrio coralliilyticus]NRF54538.1 acylneuraminate cytidylyltransferase family protein [Vibrio coralliilyticus]
MYKNNSILAVIPARGGSKRLPNKNTLELVGKPMIAWTIEAALKSRYIDKVIVSSDSDEIREKSISFGADTMRRPHDLATDTSSTFDVLKHAIENTDETYNCVMLLQPTSPLRNNKHIDESIESFFKKNADAIISVCEAEHSPLWSNTLGESLSMTHFLPSHALNKRSQDLETFYRLNGAIYLYKVSKLLEQKSLFLDKNIYAYKMDTESSIDIDKVIDFKIAELLLNKPLN